MKPVFCSLILLCLASPCLAQEQEDMTSSFAAVPGGAVFDEMVGVDGSAVTDNYILTRVTCKTGSNDVRVLLPFGPQDDSFLPQPDPKTVTLRQSADGWTVEVSHYGIRERVPVSIAPVSDPVSYYSEQYEVTVGVGSPLWRAMSDEQNAQALMLLGFQGEAMYLPRGETFSAFLRACEISEPK
jgi:hypothetical protein